MDVTSYVSMGTFIYAFTNTNKYTFLFISFVFVKVPQSRNKDIDQNVPET